MIVRNFSTRSALIQICIGLSLVTGTPCRAAFLIGLGDLAGGATSSEATAVSTDGSVVVGESIVASGRRAFRWSLADGMVDLGDLSGGADTSFARGVSGDGSVIVGGSASAAGNEAFRWTVQSGMVGLGDLPGGSFISSASAISSDSTVIVGTGRTAFRYDGFVWTSTAGMVELATFGFSAPDTNALAVSENGAVIVGANFEAVNIPPNPFPFLFFKALRWSSAGVNTLVDSGSFASAQGLSLDGSIVVGERNSQAFRWQNNLFVDLGDLPGGSFSSQATGVSADGAVVVGSGVSVAGREAFVWDSINGMRRLASVLEDDHGLDLTGWVLERAAAVTPDGLTVVGVGTHNGSREAWVAYLPEPDASLLLAAGVLALAGSGSWRIQGMRRTGVS